MHMTKMYFENHFKSANTQTSCNIGKSAEFLADFPLLQLFACFYTTNSLLLE